MGWKNLLIEAPVWLISRFYRPRFDPNRKTPREILVLRPNDFGELLTTTPLFEALRKRFPTTRLIAGVGSWARPILENNPFVDEIVEIDAPWNNKLVEDRSHRNVMRFLWKSPQVAALRARGGFDVGIDVLGSYMGAVLMMRAGVRYRIGVRGYRGGWSGCQDYIEFARRQCGRAALGQAELLGAKTLPEARPQLFLTDDERLQAAQVWNAGEAGGRRTVRIVAGVGAGVSSKAWDARQVGDALTRIAEAMEKAGNACNIVIVGSDTDRLRAEEAMAAASPATAIRSMAGEVSMRIMFALVENADVVLTNSSMLLHVAAAFQRPTVAVIGGSVTRPEVHDAIWGYPPPYRSVAPERYVPGEHALNWPSVERVVDAVIESLELQRARGNNRTEPVV
ncbi:MULTISPECIES: glycosyltransferase family 9 protein [Burkholderiaceae]|uniref:ADP-heptose--lipooligosaccharide heptosyltransferase II n=1 Tax=Caballeronia sordidicola TaxID=196367 RepID=A0A242MXC2_CABSO|nr:MULTISPECIES: glycosyltransferase family 9 protein [Burkholderiaceae]AME25798.1 heptosyltransferase [Burkholderia sp. PAMC 26561]OTP76035.1 ADP-heptose--lipooligosaccharide heptosyltransferase II [Caballeronia sordidicola]